MRRSFRIKNGNRPSYSNRARYFRTSQYPVSNDRNPAKKCFFFKKHDYKKMLRRHLRKLPCGHPSRGKLRYLIVEIDAPHSDHVHLICRIIERPVKRTIISDRRHHDDLRVNLSNRHHILVHDRTLFAVSSQTLSTKG
jgi:hypothetical protein